MKVAICDSLEVVISVSKQLVIITFSGLSLRFQVAG